MNESGRPQVKEDEQDESGRGAGGWSTSEGKSQRQNEARAPLHKAASNFISHREAVVSNSILERTTSHARMS